MKPITLREMIKEWVSQYDWDVERKILDAIMVGIGLGLWLDFIIYFFIKL
jgi:hypothetical protein